MRGRGFVVLTIVSLLLTGCDARPGVSIPSVPDGVQGVVVDTDMGLDDALALLFLASRPDIQIRAVTVVGDGLARCTAGVRNAGALLAYTGHGNVPVACGGRQPSLGVNAFPDAWRDAADDLYGLDLPTPQQVPEGTLTASELLIQALDGTTDLLTLGPFTNVADALREDPGMAERVPSVVSMAGAVDVDGNAPNGVAEYNVWVDPLAAKEVMATMRVTLVPLDATNVAPITPFFVDALGQHRGSPAADAAYDLVANDPFLVSGRYYFWDPLAAGLLAEPTLGTYRDRRLLVTASQDSGAGWIDPYAGGVDVRVTTHADALGFEGQFLSALAGERVADIRPDADLEVTFDGDACSLTKANGVPRTSSAALVFHNRSSVPAAVVVARFGGTTIYRDLLDFVGPPGSLVTGTPRGFRFLGTVEAASGDDAWLALSLRGGNITVACTVAQGEAARVWPGGWFPIP